VRTYLCDELIWAKVLLGELLDRSSSTEIMFPDVGLFSKGEVGWGHTTSIHGLLESLLDFSHLGLEIFMKFA